MLCAVQPAKQRGKIINAEVQADRCSGFPVTSWRVLWPVGEKTILGVEGSLVERRDGRQPASQVQVCQYPPNPLVTVCLGGPMGLSLSGGFCL